ncbi:efflux RND transporter periplasmic adaptor subunit [Tamlana sp. 2_MG-2023]|uniref:efflux RND transporter periplasmic adaptor subunit n=1 Tax=unclassified Tamlana TaxID=2614803 RepID=UPI0026E20E1B|nr:MULTISPECIES: efflux RND transporter periplasmic adaptor subunit [unclassified Tamlana]MDO6761072.1 efflux RND transporter periplasmic adaptor subunit [Tamlana sp. 2_MG-2023]MDO6791595.1 efflux RND transporter periplasmic adaptor subunit [Tamlana sp. 1_MG-2023]
MKHIYTIAAFTFLLISCGGKEQSVEQILAEGNIETIRTKRTELETEKIKLSEQIKLIDEKLEELDDTKKLPLVTTVKAKTENFVHYLELQGSVQTKQNIVIYPETSGILQKVYVKEGQQVSKGQTLAKIDDGGLEQQVSQMEIQLALAQTTFERQKRLWDQKIGSEIQFLQAKSNYEAQEQSVNQLKTQLAKTTITAPFTGVIDDIITDQGSVVMPGQSQLIRIVNLSDMYIETEVPENYITDVVKGKKVKVEFPVLGTSVDTEVRQASNFINPANRTFKVEIAVPNKDKHIKPNLTAKLKINDYSSKNAVLIPLSIISENANGEQYIYVIKNKNNESEAVAERVIITTGKTQGDIIEVLSGIEASAEIINEGARSVRDGQTVKVIKY